ncbi:MAG: sialate O-acetylesterase [Akkermansiaceae bacterium]|nr:sialate O-acetylesterase [Akkermansiaceae bacterium]
MLQSLKSLAALYLLTGIALAQEPPSKKEDFHVYLLIGQSNMAGRAPFNKEEAKPMNGVFLLNGEERWEVASNPLNRHSTIRKGLGMQKMNPGYSFALEMHKEGQAIGLVVNAKGGSKIEQWAADTKFYKEAVRRAREAQKTGTLKGVLWHQGESNHGRPAGYAERLAQLVENLRRDLGDEDLPFVAGQIVRPSPINDEILELPKSVENTAVASSEGLKTYDRWHFDAESVRELGKRYAQAMRKLTR